MFQKDILVLEDFTFESKKISFLEVFPMRLISGGVTIDYCSWTISYCFLEIFVWGQSRDGGPCQCPLPEKP